MVQIWWPWRSLDFHVKQPVITTVNQGTPGHQCDSIKLLYTIIYYFAYQLAHITQLPKHSDIAHLCDFTAGQTLGWQKLQRPHHQMHSGTKT